MSTNQISGNVSSAGAALNGAMITATNVVYSSPTQAVFTFSDSSGNFTISGLAQNTTYRLTVTAGGVVFRHAKIVPIVTNDIANVNFAASALTDPNS